MNSRAVGIEVGNPGHEFGYPQFPPRQIEATIALCGELFSAASNPPERVARPFRRGAECARRTPANCSPGGGLGNQAGIGHFVEPGIRCVAGTGSEAGRPGRRSRVADDAGANMATDHIAGR